LIEKRAAMREQINQLAAKFLQRCSQDVGSLRVLLGRLRIGDVAAFKELEYLAHRLSGTGALLGFESIGTCAAAIERLAEAQAGNTTPDQKVTERLTEYTARLEEEIGLRALKLSASSPLP
jgi:HPt (histidine-containing phosphotransfer) domain-containing protein